MSEQVITLSKNAADRIKQIMSQAESSTVGVRIGVKSGGCAGMSYVMEYAMETNRMRYGIHRKIDYKCSKVTYLSVG